MPWACSRSCAGGVRPGRRALVTFCAAGATYALATLASPALWAASSFVGGISRASASRTRSRVIGTSWSRFFGRFVSAWGASFFSGLFGRRRILALIGTAGFLLAFGFGLALRRRLRLLLARTPSG